MSNKIGFLKGDTAVWQDSTGGYVGGEVISADDESVLVRVEGIGGISVKVGDAYLLTTPAEMTEQLSITESLEEAVRVAKEKLRVNVKMTDRFSHELKVEYQRTLALEEELARRGDMIVGLRELLDAMKELLPAPPSPELERGIQLAIAEMESVMERERAEDAE